MHYLSIVNIIDGKINMIKIPDHAPLTGVNVCDLKKNNLIIDNKPLSAISVVVLYLQ